MKLTTKQTDREIGRKRDMQGERLMERQRKGRQVYANRQLCKLIRKTGKLAWSDKGKHTDR